MADSQSISKTDTPHSHLDRKKYESMLQEVIDQLSLTIDRKYEDVDQLNSLREKVLTGIHTSHKIFERLKWVDTQISPRLKQGEWKDEMSHLETLITQNKQEMNATVNGINEMIGNINNCITIESLFIQGTNILLKDVVQYVVSSYAKLSQLQAYDQSIIETIKSPLLVLDHELKVISGNRACFEMFGFQPEQLIGTLFGEVPGERLSLPNAPTLKQRLYRVIQNNQPVDDYEVEWPSPQQDILKKMDGESSISLPHDDGVNVTPSIFLINAQQLIQRRKMESRKMLLVSIEDITERRQTERRLTNALKQMKQINTTLKQKNEELDEFVYIASHDLQEPLRKINSFGELLRFELNKGHTSEPHIGPDPLHPESLENAKEMSAKITKTTSNGGEGRCHGKIQQYLGFMQESSQRMQQLIRDLLDLSRSGRGELHCRKIDLDRCVDRALEPFEEKIARLGVLIQRDPLPQVMGDETLLVQLYQNLIGNALKFTGKETPHLHFTAHKKKGTLILGVKDNGIGIDPIYDQQIFQPFKRLHGRHQYSGTGIGLSICKKVVTRHGGRIWVERGIEGHTDLNSTHHTAREIEGHCDGDWLPNHATPKNNGTWFRFTLKRVGSS